MCALYSPVWLVRVLLHTTLDALLIVADKNAFIPETQYRSIVPWCVYAGNRGVAPESFLQGGFKFANKAAILPLKSPQGRVVDYKNAIFAHDQF